MSTLLLNIFITGYILNKYITIGYIYHRIYCQQVHYYWIYRVSIKSIYNLKELLQSKMMRYRNEGCFCINQYFIKFLLTLKFIVSDKISYV